MDQIFTDQLHLYSKQEILMRPCPVPRINGVYAWFFKQVPSGVPVDGCYIHKGMTLLYVGISPDKKSKPNSIQTLRSRILYHYTGNAEGSTLRLSLGLLLVAESGWPLRRVGSGRRMTFTHEGEQWLDTWMNDNAFITWIPYAEPWLLEEELINKLPLPLNIKTNNHHPFAAELKNIRIQAKFIARIEPVIKENGKRSRKL